MSFIYCQSCGNKIEFTTQKPNFCPKCGTSLGSTAQAIERSQPHDTQTELSEDTSAPRITKIDCEISQNSSSETLGSIIGKGSMGEFKRKPYIPKHGSATKDSLEFCRSSKTRDIDESAK
tara:strand:+ start:163 stop:522 length:360 start_codon:yes stop_codon:yes gene_type:complete